MIQSEIQVQVSSNLTTGARLRFGYDFSVIIGFTTATSVLVETGSGDAGSAFVLDSVVVVSGVELEVECSVLVVEGTMTMTKVGQYQDYPNHGSRLEEIQLNVCELDLGDNVYPCQWQVSLGRKQDQFSVERHRVTICLHGDNF